MTKFPENRTTWQRCRVLLGVAVMTSSMIAAGAVTSATAHAAATCSGTLSWASSLKKEPRGQLAIYYNSAAGGTNTACMYHAGSTSGKRLQTEVGISRCQAGNWEGDTYCLTDKTPKPDLGNFISQAGPLEVTGTANRCVTAYGTIILANGDLVRLDSPPVGCP
ncbi:hypothetical protein [Amycolatopsis antarctica]|uniref:hypothetical protein n=1 Tax=Amycolatopsis antarctica TaxID=1854586 RepID=UPI00105518D6|nr:hypothetical protein [Amycolatopsis antarctica]